MKNIIFEKRTLKFWCAAHVTDSVNRWAYMLLERRNPRNLLESPSRRRRTFVTTRLKIGETMLVPINNLTKRKSKRFWKTIQFNDMYNDYQRCIQHSPAETCWIWALQTQYFCHISVWKNSAWSSYNLDSEGIGLLWVVVRCLWGASTKHDTHFWKECY